MKEARLHSLKKKGWDSIKYSQEKEKGSESRSVEYPLRERTEDESCTLSGRKRELRESMYCRGEKKAASSSRSIEHKSGDKTPKPDLGGDKKKGRNVIPWRD